MSSFQSVVGLIAGLTSIAGAGYSAVQYARTPTVGEVLAVVRDARTDRPVRDATIEVLTAADTLVTTLRPADDGSARGALREGAYRMRASHPKLGADARDVQVIPGQIAEVRFQLAPPSESAPRSAHRRGFAPVDTTAQAVSKSLGTAHRLLRSLF